MKCIQSILCSQIVVNIISYMYWTNWSGESPGICVSCEAAAHISNFFTSECEERNHAYSESQLKALMQSGDAAPLQDQSEGVQ